MCLPALLYGSDSQVYKDEHNKLNTVGWGTLKSVKNQNKTGSRMNGCWIHVNWIQKWTTSMEKYLRLFDYLKIIDEEQAEKQIYEKE